MAVPSPEAARRYILCHCAATLALHGHPMDDLPDGFDLRTAGIIDSLDFLELVGALESHFGIELDFEDIDPAHMTEIGTLSSFVARQTLGLQGGAPE